MEKCFFTWCQRESDKLSIWTEKRIETVKNASKQRGDNIEALIKNYTENHKDLQIRAHHLCTSEYVDQNKIRRALKRNSTKTEYEPSTSKRTRDCDKVFSFNKHCIFCGKECADDKKHPKRRRIVLCQTADYGKKPGGFKESILEVCAMREDKHSEDVKLSATSDLHAADARYHKDCRDKFMIPSVVAKVKSTECKKTSEKQTAFDHVVHVMKADTNRIWNSTELYDIYLEQCSDSNGLCKKKFVDHLSDILGNMLIVLKSPGLASILMFRSKATEMIKLVEEKSDDVDLKPVAKKIVEETHNIQTEACKETYNTYIDTNTAMTDCSQTLLDLLSLISPKFDGLPGYLIGNIVSYAVQNHCTSLLLALGVLIREKNLVSLLNKFMITCNYDELLRFRTSVAQDCVKQYDHEKQVLDNQSGLIQIVIDNFDAEVSSPNNLAIVHKLAMIVCQSPNEVHAHDIMEHDRVIRRISKSEMQLPINLPLPVQSYSGPKKPTIPWYGSRTHCPDYLEGLAAVNVAQAQNLDFEFLKSTDATNMLEYGGFIKKVAQDKGQSIQPQSSILYQPLINMNPADHSAVKTAMIEGQRLSSNSGQPFTVITADQAIYKLIIDNLWMDHDRLFEQLYARLGGMHMLMNFVGAVGKLMQETGLHEILASAFGSVQKMLSGKLYPQNVRAIRMVAEVLLAKHIKNQHTYDDLEKFLQSVSHKSPTAKLWTDNLIRPVLLMMMFTRAERESDWNLHLYVTNKMIDYFHAAGHMNYARYGTYYLHTMIDLPEEVKSHFLKGEHTVGLTQGRTNRIWTDQAIESTIMQKGHNTGGPCRAGNITSSKAEARWALSLPTELKLKQDLQKMTDILTHYSPGEGKHKEELPGRIQSDAVDRNKLQAYVADIIDPLNPLGHPKDAPINIVTGKVAHPLVNVHDSLCLGKSSRENYERKLPTGFHESIKAGVKTMAYKESRMKSAKTAVINPNAIINRALPFLSSGEIDLQDVFSTELSEVVTSLFQANGTIRLATDKSKLMQHIASFKSHRSIPKANYIVIDGVAMLWSMYWPNDGKVHDLVSAVASYIACQLIPSVHGVHLIFDHYREYSIKCNARSAREQDLHSGTANKIFAEFVLTLDSPLPPQSVSLKVTPNKVQLISLITEHLWNLLRQRLSGEQYVTVSGSKDVPLKMTAADTEPKECTILKNSHEEADTIIIQHVVDCVTKNSDATVHVRCNDTDVFVLLCHFTHTLNINANIMMVPLSHKMKPIDIRKTVIDQIEMMPHLLSLHAISGCDTVSKIHGIGKITALRALKNGHVPPALGDLSVSHEELVRQGTSFIGACYGNSPLISTMSEHRFLKWKNITKGKGKHFRLENLPPTTEAFSLHIQRASYQVAIWLSSTFPDPPNIDPLKYGWEKDQMTKSLVPTQLPPGTVIAPKNLLKILCCTCDSDEPCKSKRCSCHSNNSSCSTFCNCLDTEKDCQNPFTQSQTDSEVSDAQSDVDE